MKKAFAITLLCLSFLSTGCSLLSFKKPEIESKQIEIESADLSQLKLKLVLGINNPNAMDLPLEDLQAQVSVDGNPFLERKWSKLPILKGKKKTEVTLPLELQWQTMLNTALKFASKKTLPYQLKGKVSVKGISIPFDETGQLSLDSAK